MVLDFYGETLAALRAGREPPDPEGILARITGIVDDPPPAPARHAQPGRLNIGLVCREYPPETAFGGMATFTYHLAHGLALAGHRVTVFTAGRAAWRRDFADAVDVVRVEPRLVGTGATFEAAFRRGGLTYAQTVFLHGLGVLAQMRIVEDRHGPFDVLDLADHAAEGLALQLYRTGPATVRLYTPFALLAAMRADLASAEAARDFAVLEAASLDRAAAVTSPSADLAARVRTYFGLARDIPIVPNPLDADLFSPAEPPASRGQRIVVGFVGRLEERKGIRTLFAAIPHVVEADPRVDFRIVGRDVQGLAARAEPALPTGRVTFAPQVPLADLADTYRGFDISVVPSNYDNSPYTCVEPMACGVPVVGTTAGGIREYVVDGQTGVVISPRDPAALAGAILQLAGDAELRTRMGLAGRARVTERYDYRSVAAEMAAHYEAALEETTPPAARVPAAAPVLNRLRPETIRLECIVVAGTDVDAARRTLASLDGQGARVTVLWGGEDQPALTGVKFVGLAEPGPVIASILDDCFTVVRAGRRLPPGFVDRARCCLAATGRARAVVDEVEVWAASTVFGCVLPEGSSWEGALELLRDVAALGEEPPGLAPIAPLEPGPRAAVVRSWRHRVVEAARAGVWDPRLRPLRRLVRYGLSKVSTGKALADRLARQRAEMFTPDPAGEQRRDVGLAVVSVSRSAGGSVRLTRRQRRRVERWVLACLLPEELWPYAVCYLLRSRPPGTVKLAADVPLDALPEDYRRLARRPRARFNT